MCSRFGFSFPSLSLFDLDLSLCFSFEVDFDTVSFFKLVARHVLIFDGEQDATVIFSTFGSF